MPFLAESEGMVTQQHKGIYFCCKGRLQKIKKFFLTKENVRSEEKSDCTEE